MIEKHKDPFLNSMQNVTPLKKSGKNYKKIKTSKVNILKDTKKSSEEIHNTTPIVPKKQITKIDKNVQAPLEKKLKKGKKTIDKRVDFHGMSVEEAHEKFINTINICYQTKKRSILFITGKGNLKQYGERKTKLFYGKIREGFKKWVFEKEISYKILNVSPAGFNYGGDGAFFVYLRKNKN